MKEDEDDVAAICCTDIGAGGGSVGESICCVCRIETSEAFGKCLIALADPLTRVVELLSARMRITGRPVCDVVGREVALDAVVVGDDEGKALGLKFLLLCLERRSFSSSMQDGVPEFVSEIMGFLIGREPLARDYALPLLFRCSVVSGVPHIVLCLHVVGVSVRPRK